MVRAPTKLLKLHNLVDFSVIIGGILGITGTYWDIQHHIFIGRETFWIPPHLMVYAGVALVLFGSFFGAIYARTLKNHKLSHTFFFATIAILAATILQFVFAFFDDIWHRLFGVDITIWSPPHLSLIIAGVFIALTFIYFQRLYIHVAKLDKLKKLTFDEIILELGLVLSLALAALPLGEFEFRESILTSSLWANHVSLARPAWLYIALFVFIFTIIFGMAKLVTRRNWVATRIAVLYILYRILINIFILEASPIIPFTLIVPALVFDLTFNRKLIKLVKTSIMAAIVFYAVHIPYLLFAGMEKMYLIPPPAQPNTGLLGMGLVAVVIFALAGAVLAYLVGNKIVTQANKA